MTDLLYSDIEEELRRAVRSVLEDLAPWSQVLAGTETGDPCDAKLWRTISTDLGCAGLAVPEEFGGAGASFREAAVVLEELGRAVAPVPFLGSAVLATAAMLEAGETELLTQLAAGRRIAALAVPFSTPPGADFPATVRADGAAADSRPAAEPGGNTTLTGVVRSVADGL
ncbi:acyl-CoA dehydrogenase family protein, partial [Actinomadura sp. HBU206391]|uniref:acyl-CoA dehydrogenase family protein n=1 Tax=Actinomadura sp. HBU206391 TaxID=2731692 RepID=UPI0016508193